MRFLFDHIPCPCPLCGARSTRAALCRDCLAVWRASLATQTTACCLRCGLAPIDPRGPCWTCLRTPPAFSGTVAAMAYVSPYDGLVAQLKAGRRLWVARCLAGLLRDAMACHSLPQAAPIDFLVPIPASRASMLRRGFNPAGEIARALGQDIRVPVRRDVLARARSGVKQSRLGRSARLHATAGLFDARAVLSGERVAIVDDVMTTGGTVNAAARALLDRGAGQVIVLVAARTP